MNYAVEENLLLALIYPSREHLKAPEWGEAAWQAPPVFPREAVPMATARRPGGLLIPGAQPSRRAH